jgi:outer membrane immunogenic protein
MRKVVGLVLLIGIGWMPAASSAQQATPASQVKAAFPDSAHSDGPAPLELTLAYSTVRANAPPGGCGCFWMQGGKAEANAHLYRGWSAVVEIAGQHASNINAAHSDLSLVSYLFGPRYSYHSNRRWTPFAQVLVGGVHGFDAFFPNQNGSNITPDAFALSAGGGLNLNLDHHFAVRVAQADYFLTQLPNNQEDRQNNLRLSAGIILRFPDRR